MTNKIDIFNLSKIYQLKGQNKQIKALDNINFSIKEGETFGLLGPNGAGKTTLVQILTTLIQPTSGYAMIDGVNIMNNPKQIRNKIALMLDFKLLYYRITGYDNLKFFSKVYEIHDYKNKIKKYASEFGLEKWLDQYVENFSNGMKMKLALIRTLLIDREILFLDEPTLGLDVKSITQIIEILKESEKTIFLTSHDMNVVEKLCDRIAFLSNGKILKIGTKEYLQMVEQSEIKYSILIQKDKIKLVEDLSNQDHIKEIIKTKNGLDIILRNRDNLKDLLHILGNYNILKIDENEFSIEDLFIKLT